MWKNVDCDSYWGDPVRLGDVKLQELTNKLDILTDFMHWSVATDYADNRPNILYGEGITDSVAK